MSNQILVRPARDTGPETISTYNVSAPTEFQYSGPSDGNVYIYNDTGVKVAVLNGSNRTFMTELPGVYTVKSNSICCSDVVLWAGDLVGCGGASVSVVTPVALPEVCMSVDGKDPIFAIPILFSSGGNILNSIFVDSFGNEIKGEIFEISEKCGCASCTCEVNADLRNCLIIDCFDSFTMESLDDGNESILTVAVNGATVFQDLPSDYQAEMNASGNSNKSSWYRPWVEAINDIPGFSFSVQNDIDVAEWGKPSFKLEYFSNGNEDVTIEFFKNTTDHYTITFHSDGSYTASTMEESIHFEFGTNPYHACKTI